MLKNLYILSEGSWGIKSSEIFADLFFTLSLFTFFCFYFFQLAAVIWVSCLIVFLCALIYYFVAKRLNQSSYPIYLISQNLLFLLLTPSALLHPVLISLAVISAYFVFYFLKQKFSIHILFLVLAMLFLFFWDSIFFFARYPLRIQSPPEFLFPLIPKLEGIGIPFSFPWMGASDVLGTFYSPLEVLGIFVLIGISWVSFRRSILFIYFIAWNFLFILWFMGSGSPFFPWSIGFASIGFLIQTSPGRNFYGSFYLTILCLFIFLPLSFLMGKFGISPMMLAVFFFSVEAILIRVFLGK